MEYDANWKVRMPTVQEFDAIFGEQPGNLKQPDTFSPHDHPLTSPTQSGAVYKEAPRFGQVRASSAATICKCNPLVDSATYS